MTTKRRVSFSIIIAIAVLANIAGVGAQEKSQKINQVVTVQSGAAEPMQIAIGDQGDNTFVFVSSEMSFDGKVVRARLTRLKR